MKKFIATALAAGAMAAGGAASAQDFGTVINSLFGFGTPSYSYGTPAVVAGAQTQVYVDQYGRQFTYDQYGRQVYLNSSTQSQVIVGYDSWGRPIYGSAQTYGGAQVYGSNQYPYTYGSGNTASQYPYSYGNYAYGSRSWDRDGDGIANSRDRWPDDSRYY